MASRPRTALGRPPSAAGGRPPRQGSAAPRGRPVTAASGRGGARASTAMSMAGQFMSWAADGDSDAGDGHSPVPANNPAPVARPGSSMNRARTAAASGAVSRAVVPRPQSRAVGAGAAPGTASQRGVLTQHRPVTQQGLAGVRPATTRGRHVLDKSYYMGLLRAKLSELNHEIAHLAKENERMAEQQKNYSVYEKKAEESANELKALQGKLADLNTVIDKVHTNTDLSVVKDELAQMEFNNSNEQEAVDALFADRRDKEQLARQLEHELDTEKRQNDNLLTNMDPSVREEFENLKKENEQLTEDLRIRQEELDQLNTKKSDLEDELAVSPLKQEAMVLHEQLTELKQKKVDLEEEINTEGTPDQQRQRMLDKVKKDNEEIAAMERQMKEISEQSALAKEEMRELEEEMEDQAGEKNQKYRELRQKEQQIDEFLDTFDFNKMEEQTRVSSLQLGIVKLLKIIARNVEQLDKTAVITGLDDFQSSGLVTSGPNAQSKTLNSVPLLQDAHVQLQEEQIKIAESQSKCQAELQQIRQKMLEMSEEMKSFKDIDKLKDSAQLKQQALESEKQELESTVGVAKQESNQVRSELSRVRSQLAENDTHAQLVSLEKKLQHIEQNNFAVRDTLETRAAEGNYAPLKAQCMRLVQEINTVHVHNGGGRGGSALFAH